MVVGCRSVCFACPLLGAEFECAGFAGPALGRLNATICISPKQDRDKSVWPTLSTKLTGLLEDWVSQEDGLVNRGDWLNPLTT